MTTINCRRTDPETSLFEARNVDSDETVAAVVSEIMADGVPRMDEEIADAQVKYSASRIRHGRLYLSKRGQLITTGVKRRTRDGGLSRVWVKA